MSSDNKIEQAAAQESSASISFCSGLFQALAKTEGVITKIFEETHPVLVLHFLNDIGEEDALSYIRREKKRTAAYIASKNPPQKFKKLMSEEEPCVYVLMRWFISNLVKSGTISRADINSEDFSYSFDEHTLQGNLKSVEEFMSQNDLLRAYISLGCLIASERESFDEQELKDYLNLYPNTSKQVLMDYLDRFKSRVVEGTTAFRHMIDKLESEFGSLAVKYESAAEELKQLKIPVDSLADETSKLATSFENLKTSFRKKWLEEEGYELGANETLDTLQGMRDILDNIEKQQAQKIDGALEKAREILEKAKRINISGEEGTDHLLADFREKVDLLSGQLTQDQILSLSNGTHILARLLNLIEAREKQAGAEIGKVMFDLQEFCGPSATNSLFANFMMGKVVISDPKDKQENKQPDEQDKPPEAPVKEPPQEIEKKPKGEEPAGKSSEEQTAKPEAPEQTLADRQDPQGETGDGEQHPQTKIKIEREDTAAAPIEYLVPSHAYAGKLRASLEHTELENLLWALIYEDDLPGAFGLAYALESRDGKCMVQPSTIMAIQGSRWLTADSLAYVDSLLDIAKSHKPGHSNVEGILRLAASIRPALIQPGCGLIDWLQKPEKYSPALPILVDAVREFSKYGRAIMPEDVQVLAGSLDLTEAIRDASAAADRWLKEASAKKAKFRMATEVWRELVSSRGGVYEFLKPVISNDKDKVQDVREKLQRWQKLDYIEKTIDEITAKLSKLRTKEIVGSPRQQIIRNVQDACEYAYNWCQLVSREQEYGRRGNRLSEQIKLLQRTIRECMPSLCEALEELTRGSVPAPEAAAFACLARTIKQVCNDLNLGHASEIDKLSLPPGNQWDWISQDSRSLPDALGRRLVAMPEYLSDFGADVKEGQQNVFLRAFCDSVAANKSFTDIFKAWIDLEDYRFVEILKLALEEGQKIELQRAYDGALINSDHRLKDELAKTSGVIEQALVNGVITEELHSELNDDLQAIETSDERNFREKRRRLNDIRKQISDWQENRLGELKNDWEILSKKLGSASVSQTLRERVSTLIKEALDQKDTRVVEESLAHLREAFDKGTDLEEGLFREQKRADELSEFIAAVPRIKTWLESVRGLHEVAAAIDQGSTGAGINYGQLQRPRRDESIRAITAWRNLKKLNPNAKNLDDDIAGLLRFMGFSLVFKPGVPPVQIQNRGQDWAYCTANMSAGELARPIPQYGSLTRNRYEIICLWERPGADTIAARLRELRLNLGSVIVLYLGRLYHRQRQDLVRISRDKTVSAVLLDEILLVYLTKERDASNRLSVFLRCALPYTVLNPYTPFQAGHVPPEMFFGREDMIRELQRLGGSCIVFGGRQLGKSALLRRVQREFHNPDREQYAAVDDIKLLGDPMAMKETSQIWGRIRECLKSMGLLGKTITTDRADEIKKYVKEVMQQNTQRKLILLFDEADNFLEADAKANFREVDAMRTLMLESEYRFKVVFAGLQNVQRFQGIPNQPLAHFGTPIRVGPLEADAARRLVSEPLEALGYRFADVGTTVLRILSYTNYHPGLIQLFCQELVKRLEGLTGNIPPPFIVKHEDVEAVYRLDEVRNRIKERFDWTLALSSQYQAIAWVMVLDQIEKRDSYARVYPPGNLLNLARDYWRDGFSHIGLDEFRGLLDEMCGLGVLVRNQDGHYRLRSPNLVRLLGTDEDILNNLSELARKKAPLTFDADNYHVPLKDTESAYSPFTFSQERNLYKQQSGASLIFSSDALGLPFVKSALNKFVSSDSTSATGFFAEMPAEILCADTMIPWLEKHLETNKKYENLIVYRRIYEADGHDVAGCIHKAIMFCRRQQSRKRWLRIYFVFDPSATWSWVTLPDDVRKENEDMADAWVCTRKWNLDGLKQRMAQHDKLHQKHILELTLSVTGGWPVLLEELFDRCGKRDDVRPHLSTIREELQDPSKPLRKGFLASHGIQENEVAYTILDYLRGFRENEWVPIGLIGSEYLTGDRKLSEEKCKAGIEYLARLGCIEIRDDEVLMDPIVRIVMT